MSNATNSTTEPTDTSDPGMVLLEGTNVTLTSEEGAGPNGETAITISVDLTNAPVAEAINLLAGDGIGLEYDEETNSYTVSNECCDGDLVGTAGCAYPADPTDGALHYDGGDSGWIEMWNGDNWIRTCFPVGTEMTATDTANGEISLLVVESCDAATEVSVVTTGLFTLTAINGVGGDSSGNFDICGLPAVADIGTVTFLVCEDGAGKGATAADIIQLIADGLPAVSTATMGTAIPVGALVVSSDGDLLYNCSGNPLTPTADTSTSALETLGLCLAASISTSAPISGNGTAANPITMTDAALAAALGNPLAMAVILGSAGVLPVLSTNLNGVVPTTPAPYAWVDDTVLPGTLMLWDATAGAFVAYGGSSGGSVEGHARIVADANGVYTIPAGMNVIAYVKSSFSNTTSLVPLVGGDTLQYDNTTFDPFTVGSTSVIINGTSYTGSGVISAPNAQPISALAAVLQTYNGPSVSEVRYHSLPIETQTEFGFPDGAGGTLDLNAGVTFVVVETV